MAQVQKSLLEEQQETMPGTDPSYEAWFRRQVEDGLRDVREGRVVSNEQMNAEASALLKTLREKATHS